MSNVVAAFGNVLPGDPNPDIVEELERLLDEAQRGELQAIAYCTIRDGCKGTGWAGNAKTSEPLAAAIMMLNHRYASYLLREGEE